MSTEETLFADALGLSDLPERRAFLDKACGGDAALRARVEALLAANDRAGSFLEAPPVDLAPLDAGGAPAEPVERPGAMVGPYKLLEQIGEGGMGVVFMAEQVRPVRRRVALKIIKPGMDTKQVIGRFEAERQALAMMDHPNIAKVLDAGATDAGRPYFVMELVRGIPVTDYCDQQKLPPRQRLELFIHVCQAVQHAHSKGIIHRDLKPNNVLVTLADDGKPVPKVIDFGIAKATVGQRLTEQTLFTEFRQLVGTPLYMSPEQAETSALQDVDTRSDVYSLGVLLYELLTGTTPFDKQRLAKAAFDEVRRIIREEEPPRPSTRISTLGDTLTTVSASRQTDPRKLSTLLRGELDWIVMRALEKDRGRRYETANGLARDIERHLADEPVEACPPSARYRLRKLIHRHRVPLAVAAGFLLVLVAATAVSSWQAIRATQAKSAETAQRLLAESFAASEASQRKQAERATANEVAQRKQAEATAQLLQSIFERLDPLAEQNPEQNLRDQLMTRLDEMAAGLNQNYVGDPLVRARLRNTLGVVHLHLGDTDKAMALFESAAEEQRAHAAPDDQQTLKTLYNLGCMYRVAGRTGDAIRLLGEVKKTLIQKFGVANQDTLFTVVELAKAYEGAGQKDAAIGILKEVTGRQDNAIKLLEEVQDRGVRWRGYDRQQVEHIMKLVDGGGTRSAEVRMDPLRQRLEALRQLTPGAMRPALMAERALLNARLGYLVDAAQDFAKAQQMDPEEHWVWFRRGCLLAYLGDTAAYRAQCESMLSRFGQTQDPDLADRLIKTVLLLRDGPSGRAPAEVIERLRPAVELLKSNARLAWRVQVIGMFDYRAGNFAQAARALSATVTHLPAAGGATSALYLALTCHEQGDDAFAATALCFALQMIRNSVPAQGEDLGPDPQDWFVCQVALREAQQTFLPAIVDRRATADEWNLKLRALFENQTPPKTEELSAARSDPLLLANRGELNARLGRFRAAADDFTRAIKLMPENYRFWHDGLMPLLLQLGDEAAYRRQLELELNRFSNADGIAAHRVAKDALAIPLEGAQLRVAVELADRAFATDRGWAGLQTKGMAEYRIGHYREAIRLLQESNVLTGDTYFQTITDFFLAMSYKQVGEHKAALAAMQQAIQRMNGYFPKPGEADLGGFPDWILCHTLRREAEALIGSAAVATHPASTRPTPRS